MSTEVVRVTVVIEYPVDLDHYPDCSTVAEAAEFDKRENPFLDFPMAYLNVEDEIKSVTFEAATID
ncbi:hypothetical protein ACFWOT_09360 [Streptomyces sp. NPDC058440]|uniref:hypothetical protein n=1 Tax=Streptomyces sp. NPDC058440 TaxID=3346501 RepID=UPI0036584314